MGDKLEYLTKCPYCQSGDFSSFLSAPDRFSKRDEIFSTVTCAKCDLVFQNPRVKEEYIGEYYGEGDSLGYYQIPKEKKKTFSSKIKTWINRQVLIQYFDYFSLGRKNTLLKLFLFPFKRIQKINSFPVFVENGTALEIGCSHGAHLKRLKDLGWSVVGLEMYPKMAAHARTIGLDVSSGRIEDAEFSPESFDVIIMSMVLEHLHDPFGNLKRITKWLKPGGQLIFSIPYIEGFEFRVFKEYCYGLQLPHHLTFLNKKIMREYLTKLGYADIEFYFQFFDRDVITSAEFKYAGTGRRFYRILHRNKVIRLCIVKPLVFILSFFQKTSRVTVHATKSLDSLLGV